MLNGGTPITEQEYLTRAITNRAADFIESAAGRPFLLCVSYSAVHSQMQAAREDYNRFPHIEDPHRRVFAGMLAALDDGVRDLRSTLNRRGLTENTLVLFLSDNGGPTAELTSTNAPLRAGKGSLYEGGVRVPMLAAWPGVVPAGRVVDEPVWALDLTATALAAAGGAVPKNWDGIDLLPGPCSGRNRCRSTAAFIGEWGGRRRSEPGTSRSSGRGGRTAGNFMTSPPTRRSRTTWRRTGRATSPDSSMRGSGRTGGWSRRTGRGTKWRTNESVPDPRGSGTLGDLRDGTNYSAS